MCLYILEWPITSRNPQQRFAWFIYLKYCQAICPIPYTKCHDIMQCVKCAIKSSLIKSNGSLQLAQYRFDLALIATVNFNWVTPFGMLQVLLHRPIQYTPKLFILQLSNWPALSRAHRVFFWPMRMSNWRHNGVCSSFQQRQRHCQSYLHSIQHGFHPTRRPAGCVETMSQTLWVGNGLASRPPCHELRNLCATDN